MAYNRHYNPDELPRFAEPEPASSNPVLERTALHLRLTPSHPTERWRQTLTSSQQPERPLRFPALVPLRQQTTSTASHRARP
jgi:hypothetical protein